MGSREDDRWKELILHCTKSFTGEQLQLIPVPSRTGITPMGWYVCCRMMHLRVLLSKRRAESVLRMTRPISKEVFGGGGIGGMHLGVHERCEMHQKASRMRPETQTEVFEILCDRWCGELVVGGISTSAGCTEATMECSDGQKRVL